MTQSRESGKIVENIIPSSSQIINKPHNNIKYFNSNRKMYKKI